MKINAVKVKMLIAKRCMSVNEFVGAAHIASSTMRLALSGNKVTVKTLGKIAKALGVDPEDIIEQED